jgi:acyl-CoA synthetase (AMP-forming)/AMP-acid ligase II
MRVSLRSSHERRVSPSSTRHGVWPRLPQYGIAGENVYPAAIEEVLHDHPGVNEVAVVRAPDETWNERVKACIVPVEDESITGDDIVEYVEYNLASYKKPIAVEFYDK